MKIYDISQEVFSSQVYPGDPAPKKIKLRSIEKGDEYNLTAFNMCAHNGTHIDAPRHFIKDGQGIDEISLESCVGQAYVVEHSGVVTEKDALSIMEKAKETNEEAAKRILLKGYVEISLKAAEALAESGILLIGNEPQTVGPQNEPMAVHLALLSEGVVLLEGIRLKDVEEGVYFLNAAPLNLAGSDGAPCRAILIED